MMNTSDHFLRTDIKDQRQPGWTRRGSRYWSQAEVSGDALYIVEGWPEIDGQPGTRAMRFVTTDVSEALEIPTQYGLILVVIHACAWNSSGIPVFGRVDEVYRDDPQQAVFVRLENGEAFLSSPAAKAGALTLGKRVFAFQERPGATVGASAD